MLADFLLYLDSPFSISPHFHQRGKLVEKQSIISMGRNGKSLLNDSLLSSTMHKKSCLSELYVTYLSI
jgi:hypothetical protein